MPKISMQDPSFVEYYGRRWNKMSARFLILKRHRLRILQETHISRPSRRFSESDTPRSARLLIQITPGQFKSQKAGLPAQLGSVNIFLGPPCPVLAQKDSFICLPRLSLSKTFNFEVLVFYWFADGINDLRVGS